MTRRVISNMAAMFGTLLAACLLLFSGVSGFPLGQETQQARSCGYEVRFVPFCTLIYLIQLVYADLVSFATKVQARFPQSCVYFLVLVS